MNVMESLEILWKLNTPTIVVVRRNSTSLVITMCVRRVIIPCPKAKAAGLVLLRFITPGRPAGSPPGSPHLSYARARTAT